MRWLFKQDSPLGCAFGSDCFHLAGPRDQDASGQFNLKEGRLTNDSAGKLLDVEASSDALKAAVLAIVPSRAARFFPGRSQRVFLSVPSHLLHFRTIRLAPMPDAELLSATHWKMAEETGLDAQESTSQIVTAWPVEESAKQKTEVLAVLAKNQDLEPYLQAVRQDDAVDSDLEDAPLEDGPALDQTGRGHPGDHTGRSVTGPRCACRVGRAISAPCRAGEMRLA